jgi:hypothetical protein
LLICQPVFQPKFFLSLSDHFYMASFGWCRCVPVCFCTCPFTLKFNDGDTTAIWFQLFHSTKYL